MVAPEKGKLKRAEHVRLFGMGLRALAGSIDLRYPVVLRQWAPAHLPFFQIRQSKQRVLVREDLGEMFPVGGQVAETLDDRGTIEIASDPPAPVQLRRYIGRPRPAERVEHHASRIASQVHDAIHELQRQGVGVALLVFGVPYRGNVGPYIRQVDALGVHLVLVAAVIAQLAAAMAAAWSGYPVRMEDRRLVALDEVQERVVRRVEASGYGQRVFDVNRNPVTEGKAFAEVCTERQVPLRQAPEEQRSARLERPDHFVEPCLAPGDVIVAGDRVVDVRGVFLLEVEVRVGKRQIH